MSETGLFPEQPPVAESIACDDLDQALADYTEHKGYRLFSIFPADSPREAIVERDGSYIRLEVRVSDSNEPRKDDREFVVTKAPEDGWHSGRAGMEYRDLIPGRLGGKLIASHIRIPVGGPVPDYVHFHDIDFQVIFCLNGWSRLVYEGHGEPFVFEAGDCVLQPPGIRHRVLECSDGFEVVELSSPAEHATYADHEIELPSEDGLKREYLGQRFALAKARKSAEDPADLIHQGSGGKLDVSIHPIGPDAALEVAAEDPAFLFVADGFVTLKTQAKESRLGPGDSALVVNGGLVEATVAADLIVFRLYGLSG